MKLRLLNSNTTLDIVQLKSTAIGFNSDFTVDIQATTAEFLGEVSNVFMTLNTDEGIELLRGIITEFSFYVSHLKVLLLSLYHAKPAISFFGRRAHSRLS